jgi:hypothetical protein
MGMLIYVILHRLCLVNEQNAMINMKNDMVKNIKKPDDLKKNPAILALKKSGHYILSRRKRRGGNHQDISKGEVEVSP